MVPGLFLLHVGRGATCAAEVLLLLQWVSFSHDRATRARHAGMLAFVVLH